MLTDDARALLSEANTVHLAVVDAKGRPHVTPVWADVDDADRVIVNTAMGRVKDRYLQIGDPVAISVTDGTNPYRWTQVRGRVAERTTDDGDAVIDALAMKYMGVERYPLHNDAETRVTVRIDVDSVVPRPA